MSWFDRVMAAVLFHITVLPTGERGPAAPGQLPYVALPGKPRGPYSRTPRYRCGERSRRRAAARAAKCRRRRSRRP